MKRNESGLNKLLKKYLLDSIEILFSKDIQGFGNGLTMLSVIAHENKTGFIGGAHYLLEFLCALALPLFMKSINENHLNHNKGGQFTAVAVAVGVGASRASIFLPALYVIR